MMKKLIIYILFLYPCLLWAQIERVEYFFDTDPGCGNGMEIGVNRTVIEDNSLKTLYSLSMRVPLDGLSDGVHTLYLRTKSKHGWSHSQSRAFVVMNLPGEKSADVQRVECFFDRDPGYGKATSLEVAPAGDRYAYNIELNDLSDGFHTLYFRVQNKAGRWSHVMSRAFYKTALPGETMPDIVYAEYYFDTDPGKGSGTEFDYAIAESAITFTADLNNLSSGDHTIYLRGKFRSSNWENIGQHDFSVIGGDFIESVGNEIKAWPNPVANELFVKNDDLAITRVEVVSVGGQVISQQATESSLIHIPFASYASGVYFIRLNGENEAKTIKIVKQ